MKIDGQPTIPAQVATLSWPKHLAIKPPARNPAPEGI
jgi:hypothetical protein